MNYSTGPLSRNLGLSTLAPDANRDVLESLATGTGGFVVRDTNDLFAGLEKINSEQDHYYLIGYAPPESDVGSCHALKVRVARAGVHIRSRTGYCTVKPEDALAGSATETKLEAEAAAPTSGNVKAYMSLPYFFTAVNTARVNVAIDIPASAIVLDKSKRKYSGVIDVLGMAYADSGELAAKFGDTVKIKLDTQEAVEQFLAHPYHYETEFEIASGKYRVKVAFSLGAIGFGKVEMPLSVDRYDGESLALSAVALSKDFHPLTEAQAVGLESELLSDQAPLVSSGVEVKPIGSDVFHRGDPCAMYVEIYDPSLAHQFAADAGGLKLRPLQIGLSVLIIDLQTGEKKLDTGFMDMRDYVKLGNPVVPIALKLPVQNLAAGTYRTYVDAKDSVGNIAPMRSADFKIE